MKKEKGYDKRLRKAQKFFENVVKIYGENQLYRQLFGELPIDDETVDKIKQYHKMVKYSKPLMTELEVLINDL